MLTSIDVNPIAIMTAMASDIRCRFAKHLRQLRTRKKLSVSELAHCSRISRQHIRELELPIPQKRVTITTLEKLAKGLKIPLWKLLQFKD